MIRWKEPDLWPSEAWNEWNWQLMILQKPPFLLSSFNPVGPNLHGSAYIQVFQLVNSSSFMIIFFCMISCMIFRVCLYFEYFAIILETSKKVVTSYNSLFRLFAFGVTSSKVYWAGIETFSFVFCVFFQRNLVKGDVCEHNRFSIQFSLLYE